MTCFLMILTLMTLNDLEPQNRNFNNFVAIFVCNRVNCDEMDGHRPRKPANKNCCKLLRVSRALAQISCFSSLETVLYSRFIQYHIKLIKSVKYQKVAYRGLGS